METLTKSFEDYRGSRGVHLISEAGCIFYFWEQVLGIMQEISTDDNNEFRESLVSVLSNYNPNTEFLVLDLRENKVLIELYSLQK
jgi:hypothetical protein